MITVEVIFILIYTVPHNVIKMPENIIFVKKADALKLALKIGMKRFPVAHIRKVLGIIHIRSVHKMLGTYYKIKRILCRILPVMLCKMRLETIFDTKPYIDPSAVFIPAFHTMLIICVGIQ